jgi:hypothetical protein
LHFITHIQTFFVKQCFHGLWGLPVGKSQATEENWILTAPVLTFAATAFPFNNTTVSAQSLLLIDLASATIVDTPSHVGLSLLCHLGPIIKDKAVLLLGLLSCLSGNLDRVQELLEA